MITQAVIDQLYKTYKKTPLKADDLDVDLLFEHLIEHHDIQIDDYANLILGSLPESSPFYKIPLSNIHAIVEFEKKIAVVLHSSIIFLNKFDNRSTVHIKMPKRSILDRLFPKRDPER